MQTHLLCMMCNAVGRERLLTACEGAAAQVSIPLDVSVEGGRSGEWDTF